MAAKYTLPRFMSRKEWEALSADNFYWLEQAGKWLKFHPSHYDDWPAWKEDWAMMNFFASR